MVRDHALGVRPFGRAVVLLWSTCLVGCAGGQAQVPDPQPSLLAYEEALVSQDSERLWTMLSSEAQQAYSQEEVAALVDAQHEGLLLRANGLTAPGASLQTTAQLRLPSGRQVLLNDTGDGFLLDGTGIAPSPAQLPEQALLQMASALRSRRMQDLLAVLAPRRSHALEGELDSLADSLERVKNATIELRSERAVITLPDGLVVKLSQHDGAWYVEEIE